MRCTFLFRMNERTSKSSGATSSFMTVISLLSSEDSTGRSFSRSQIADGRSPTSTSNMMQEYISVVGESTKRHLAVPFCLCVPFKAINGYVQRLTAEPTWCRRGVRRLLTGFLPCFGLLFLLVTGRSPRAAPLHCKQWARTGEFVGVERRRQPLSSSAPLQSRCKATLIA